MARTPEHAVAVSPPASPLLPERKTPGHGMPMTVRVPCPACGAVAEIEVGDPKPHCPHCKKAVPPIEEVETPQAETSEVPAAGKPGERRAGSRSGPAVADDTELLPRRLKNYELIEIIGRGGMGVVYRARQVDLDRMVALKLVRTPHPRQEDSIRFVVEAQVTGQIEHPNIVPVHEIGTDEKGRPYFVMKLVRGQSLSDVLLNLRKGDAKTQRAFPFTRLLNIFCEVCQAMAFAHSKGVLHRDIKPANVMIGDFGEVQLMDWGLARKFGEPDTHTAGLVNVAPGARPLRVKASGDAVRTIREDDTLAAQGLVAGTPEYMSPEQAAGEPAALHPRSDVYSLGALLYEIVNFRPPHIDPDTRVLMRKVATEPVVFPKPGGNRPKIGSALRAVTLKALSMNPEDRYPSALALLLDVRAVLNDEPVAAKPDTVLDKSARVLRRHGAVLATAAAALVLLSLGAAAASWVLTSEAQKSAFEKEQRLEESERRQEAVQRALEESKRRASAEGERAQALEEKRRAESQNIENANRLARAIPLFLDALELSKRRRYDAAIAQLQLVIEADPFSPVAALAYFARGEAWQSKGGAESGRKAIQDYLAADKLAQAANKAGDPRAVMRCGEVALRLLGDTDLALGYYERAYKIEPSNPYGMMGLAYAHILRGRAALTPEEKRKHGQEALNLALNAIALGDFLWEAHYIAGSLYGGLELPESNLQDLAKAPQHLTQALVLEPNATDLWLARAKVMRAIGDRTAAISDLGTYLRLRPESVEALAARTELFLEFDRPTEALADAERVLAFEPQHVGALKARAAALAGLMKLPEAENAYGDALALYDRDASLWLRRAQVRMQMRRYADAAADAGKAWTLDEKNLDALKLRADARMKSGQPVEAAADYKLLQERAPGKAGSLLGLADALRLQGKGKEAIEAYRAVVQQDPDRQDVRLKIVQMLIEDSNAAWYDPAEAIKEARAAEQSGKDNDPKIMIALAEALRAGNQHKDALAIVERAYSLFPTDADVQACRERLRQAAKPSKK
ncbi:MAG: protein kinase [Planctomycetes bacterium]|nr:protein kinase [Planctomycetota bacterium]